MHFLVRYHGRLQPFGRFGRCPTINPHWNHWRHFDNKFRLHQRRFLIRCLFWRPPHERQVRRNSLIFLFIFYVYIHYPYCSPVRVGHFISLSISVSISDFPWSHGESSADARAGFSSNWIELSHAVGWSSGSLLFFYLNGCRYVFPVLSTYRIFRKLSTLYSVWWRWCGEPQRRVWN